MSLTIDDIDDMSISDSRVIVAVGTRRYLFGGLDRNFTDNLKRYQLEERLAESAEAGILIRRIAADNAEATSRKPMRDILCISSRTVTIVSRRLAPLTSLPLSAIICIASAICLALAFKGGLSGRVQGFAETMRVYDIAIVLASYICSIFVHEFGHAVLCLKKTGLVGSITVRLSRGLPVFATDVSSLHLASRASQAKIAVAGVLFQICFASLLLMVPILAVQIGGMLALVAALFSLLPFPRSDGYWFMNDALGIDLSRTYREASPIRKMLHLYTLWLITTHMLIWYLLFYSGFELLWRSVSERQLLISGAALWAIYILYAVLVVSSHAVRTVGFLRNGTLSRWDRSSVTG